nr:hypothetical protein [Candidatus Njordarchaeota archaeon]
MASKIILLKSHATRITVDVTRIAMIAVNILSVKTQTVAAAHRSS